MKLLMNRVWKHARERRCVQRPAQRVAARSNTVSHGASHSARNHDEHVSHEPHAQVRLIYVLFES